MPGPLVFLTALGLAAAGCVLAAQPASSPGQSAAAESSLELHGFLLGELAPRTSGERPSTGPGSDFVLGEERLRLELGGSSKGGDSLFLVKGDVFHDAVANRVETDLREAYGGWTRGNIDLRAGRQIVTWGVGDLFFINDVFPKDWDSFFSGRPMEYLKLGVDALRVRRSSAGWSVDLLAIPFFTADRPPSPERFVISDPFSNVPSRRELLPQSTLSNTELALRFSKQVSDMDVSLYGYHGFWRSPPGMRLDLAPPTVTRFYPGLAVYGASAQGNRLGGVLSLETGYCDSLDQPDGRDPSRPNSQWRFLAGYQRQPWQDFTIGVQAYGELMTDYAAYREALPSGSPVENEFRGMVSVRLTELLDYQTWKLSLFAAHSPTVGDSFVQPEVTRKMNDELSLSMGANLFRGRTPTGYFGPFDGSDNVFVRVRSDF